MAADPAGTRDDDDRPARRDPGFTLLETIVVVLLVAVLSSVMAAVVAVVLRTAPSTEARVDNSNSYQRLIIRLQRDAASTPPDGFKTGTTPPSPPAWSCSGVSGPTLVQMSSAFEGTAYVAGYRLEPDGDGQRISRYSCSGPASSFVLSSPTIDSVTTRLHDANAVELLAGPTVVGVRIDMTLCRQVQEAADCTQPGTVVSVEASSRNPAKVLPP